LLCLDREVIYVNVKLFLTNWVRVCLYVRYELSQDTFTLGLGRRYMADFLHVVPTAVWQMTLVITCHFYVHTFIHKNFRIQFWKGTFSYILFLHRPLEFWRKIWVTFYSIFWWNSSSCTQNKSMVICIEGQRWHRIVFSYSEHCYILRSVHLSSGACNTSQNIPGSVPGRVTEDFIQGIRQVHVPGVDSAP
jgi:hypothetical protein